MNKPPALSSLVLATILCTFTTSLFSQYTDSTIFTFNRTGGSSPAGLVRDSAGNLYGYAQYGGGVRNPICASECGTIFKLTQSGGVWTESVLHTFSGHADGGQPNGITSDASGNVYVSTIVGGVLGQGTVV